MALRETVRIRTAARRHPKVHAGWSFASRAVTPRCYRAGGGCGNQAERRAACERAGADHHVQLAELLTHVAAAIDRYRADEIDAPAVDETIHHYHRAAGELWKICFARGEGSHAEFIAGLLDRMTADAETIDWWERATPRPRQ